MINWEAMRRDMKNFINEDPWTITVYRRGKRTSDAETTWTFTARVVPVNATGYMDVISSRLEAEGQITRALFGIVAEWDTAQPKQGDEVWCEHTETGQELIGDVHFSRVYPYKQEIVCEQRQK